MIKADFTYKTGERSYAQWVYKGVLSLDEVQKIFFTLRSNVCEVLNSLKAFLPKYWYQIDILGILKKNESSDRREDQAFNCLIHFYKRFEKEGLRALEIYYLWNPPVCSLVCPEKEHCLGGLAPLQLSYSLNKLTNVTTNQIRHFKD